MKRNTLWLVVISLIVTALLVASCAPATTKEGEEVVGLVASEEPVYGGTLTTTTGVIRGFDPVSSGQETSRINTAIMDRLGIGDWTKGPMGTNECPWMSPSYETHVCGRGYLIESWEQTGPLTFVGKVREGVKFNACLPHIKAIVNDREMTAGDIYYCWNRVLNWPTVRTRAAEFLESIEVLSRYEIGYVLKKPHINAIDTLFYELMVYPPEVAETYEDLNNWRNQCGTGPYILTEFITDSSWTLERNPDYWAYDELHPDYRLPYIDTVRGLLIVDRMSEMAAFRTGKVDLLLGVNLDDATVMEVSNPEAGRRGAIEEVSRPSIDIRCDQPPFDDVRVRQAVVMAINFQEIVEQLYGGEGSALCQPALELWPEWYKPLDELPEDIQEIWRYNPGKARELLEEVLGPGAEFEFNVYTTEDYVGKVTILQRYWDEVGAHARIKVMEGGSLRSFAYGENYDGMFAMSHAVSMPPEELLTRASTSRSCWAGRDWESPEFDEIIQKLTSTIEHDEQMTLYEMARDYNLRNLMRIRFPHPYVYTYWQPWIGGYSGENALGGSWGALYARIWVDQEVKAAMGY